MESLKHWATIFFARAVKQLDKNPDIYERKETEQVWQGRESHCYFGDNYFRESQRLDVPLYQSSNKRCIIQTQGGVNSAGKYIFMLWKYPWKITVMCSYLHRKKKRRKEQVWTAIVQAKTRAVSGASDTGQRKMRKTANKGLEELS